MTGREIRRIVLQQSARAHVGHIGSALSIADILAALYGRVLRIEDPEDVDRDRFVLSKGHAALALYAALHLRGWISSEQLGTFCEDGSLLGVHPDHHLRGIDFSTGSLGHGLSLAAGAALGARLSGSPRRAFVLMSDAECNEGSVWEAAMFAAHHRLGQLTAIIDRNGQQALGRTEEILRIEPLAERWSSFGWDAREIDGHDVAVLAAELDRPASSEGAPRVLIARTVFGKGVSFMHGQIPWHYLPLSEEQFAQAMRELELESSS